MKQELLQKELQIEYLEREKEELANENIELKKLNYGPGPGPVLNPVRTGRDRDA